MMNHADQKPTGNVDDEARINNHGDAGGLKGSFKKELSKLHQINVA
jgi:hypothetical protein